MVILQALSTKVVRGSLLKINIDNTPKSFLCIWLLRTGSMFYIKTTIHKRFNITSHKK